MSGCNGKKNCINVGKNECLGANKKKISISLEYGFFLKFENDDENSSARSANLMVKPKKITDGLPLTSGKASLLIFRGGKFGVWLSQSLLSTQQIINLSDHC